MKFDIYANHSYEVVTDNDSTKTEQSTTQRFRNLTLEDAKSKVDDIFKNIPENANNFYLEVHKSYEEQMDAALKSI
jgi:hypothetical protein